MNRTYEFLSLGGNLISFDLEKMVWVKSCFPEIKIQISFERGNDLIVSVQDVQMAQALVADISKRKAELYADKEEKDGGNDEQQKA